MHFKSFHVLCCSFWFNIFSIYYSFFHKSECRSLLSHIIKFSKISKNICRQKSQSGLQMFSEIKTQIKKQNICTFFKYFFKSYFDFKIYYS